MTAIKFPKRENPRLKSLTGHTIKMFDFATIDFETEAIRRRPHYPPKPTSVSIKKPGEKKATFYSWGHPEGNNCDPKTPQRIIKDLYRSDTPLLFQHGKFDVDVAEVWMDLPVPSWERIHDTEYLLFLHDPHARSLSLKPAAERILGMKPEEQDKLHQWLIDHKIVKKNQSDWGAQISKAPGNIVGPYANGDITRTEGLFKKLLNEISQRNMMGAYNRERRLMPILLRTEQQGFRVDMRQLEKDYAIYSKLVDREMPDGTIVPGLADDWLRKTLKSPHLNIDADKDLGEALDHAGIVTEWIWTKGGKNKAPQRSVSKANLTLDKFNNPRVGAVYGYRNRLRTCLGMFMEPWLEMARASSDGSVYTNWNQVRQDHGGDNVGARTGRLSSNPNFQNISKDFEDKDDGYKNPTFLKALLPLPLMRKYLVPDKGEIWGHRDFNQQELRFLAHFEDGSLAAHYREDPRFDVHSSMQEGVFRIAGIKLTRSGTKILNFSDIYGKGEGNLALSLGVDLGTIKQIRAAKAALMPDVAALSASVKQRGIDGEAIRTWGGREYFKEESAFVKKRGYVMDFGYKLLNYLIQGSSADMTKEAVIRYDAHPKRQARFLLTVHDEINASMPRARLREEMKILKECMEGIPEIDVPMASDGKTGKNWGSLEKFKD